MLRGFRNFLMRGDVVVVAVGLVVALAFSNLVKAFTDNIINPLIAAAQGGVKGPGLGWQLVSGGGDGTYLNLGAFISAIIYFIIFMAVVYFLIVVPYKTVMARLGKTVFGDPPRPRPARRAGPTIWTPPRPGASTAARNSAASLPDSRAPVRVHQLLRARLSRPPSDRNLSLPSTTPDRTRRNPMGDDDYKSVRKTCMGFSLSRAFFPAAGQSFAGAVRQEPGVIPMIRRKRRLKVERSLKPAS